MRAASSEDIGKGEHLKDTETESMSSENTGKSEYLGNTEKESLFSDSSQVRKTSTGSGFDLSMDSG